LGRSGSESGHAGKPGIKERAREELRRFLWVSLYLYVCLAALIFYKTALMREVGVSSFVLGVALGKALILAKFLLLGEAAGVGSRSEAPTLLHAILRKSVMLFLLLIALSVLEEFVVAWFHGHSFAQTLGQFEAHSVMEMLAKCVLLLLVLLPLVAATEVSRELGPGVLRRLIFARRSGGRPADGAHCRSDP
jgi:hypothetical protein